MPFVLYNTILITVALYYCLKYKKSMILRSLIFHTHDGFGYSESFASPQVLGVIYSSYVKNATGILIGITESVDCLG